jgi:hypothetical protein
MLSCALVAHASVDPAFARGDGAPATIPLTPPGLTTEVEPPAQPISGNPSSAADHGDTESRWYGHQVLLVDAIGIALFSLGVARHEEGTVLLGTTVVLLGAPTVHAFHNEGGNMLLSFPLRVLLPLGGFVLGTSVGGCTWECGGPGDARITISLAMGAAAASIIDAVFIARTRPKKRRTVQPPAWAPQLGVTGNGFSAGISGWF